MNIGGASASSRAEKTKLSQEMRRPQLPSATGGPVADRFSPTIDAKFAPRQLTQSFANSLAKLELKNRLKIRLVLCWILSATLAFSTVCFFGLVALKAFSLDVSGSLLGSVGAATVTQVSLLLGVFVRSVWREDTEKPN